MYTFQLKKTYQAFTLHVSFSVADDETLVILGPSGCGKSTLLNVITGVVHLDEGSVKQDNTLLVDTKTNTHVPIHQRNIGYIQQKSNLFPHLTIFENLIYGVKNRKSRAYRDELDRLLTIFQLNEDVDKRPGELSGGQQQRVSIIRALMSRPSLLLFDEPFSALDNPLRIALREQLINIKQDLKVPIIFVTHDLEEGYDLGDRVIIMNEGHIVEEGTTSQIFNTPKQIKTAQLLGMKNIWDGRVIDCIDGVSCVDIHGIQLHVNQEIDVGKEIKLGIKSTDVLYVKKHRIESDQRLNLFHGKIMDIKRTYNGFLLAIKVNDLSDHVFMNLPDYVVRTHGIYLHDRITVCINQEKIIVFEDRNETL